MKRVLKYLVGRCDGYTLTEVLIASTISLLISGMGIGLYVSVGGTWQAMNQRMEADSDLNLVLSRMVYGVDEHPGLRTAKGVRLLHDAPNWTLAYTTINDPETTNTFVYTESDANLVFNPGNIVIGRDIISEHISAHERQVVITLAVEKVTGRVPVRRQLGTTVSWRN